MMTEAEKNRVREAWIGLHRVARMLRNGAFPPDELATEASHLADRLTPVLNGDLSTPEPAAQASLFDGIAGLDAAPKAIQLVFRSE